MKNNLSQKIGIFAFSLLITVFAVYFYSPVISSHADTASKNLEVNAEIEPVISFSNNTGMVDIDAVSAYRFVSSATTLSVNTNSTFGYSLMIEDLDESSDLVNQSDNTYKITSTFNGTKTSSTMESGTWGFSVDNTNYRSVPTIGNPTLIKSTNSLAITGDNTTVTFGINPGASSPAGHYIDYVLFTAVVNGQGAEPYNMPAMPKTMQAFNCSNGVPGQQYVLTDTRNNKTYHVKTDEHGKCWMLENLDLTGLEVSSENSAFKGSDSNVLNFTVPPSTANWNFSYSDPEVYETNNPQYGAYYNYAAASANFSGNSEWAYRNGSICPAGWEIPDSTYITNYISDPNFLNFTKSGMYDVDNGVLGQGEFGAWWVRNYITSSSDENIDEIDAVLLTEDGKLVTTKMDGKNGLSIRCMQSEHVEYTPIA